MLSDEQLAVYNTPFHYTKLQYEICSTELSLKFPLCALAI